MLSKLLKKSFDLDLEDALNYPSNDTICNTIQAKEPRIVFTSKIKPITFTLDDIHYVVEIKIVRGGYGIVCKEI